MATRVLKPHHLVEAAISGDCRTVQQFLNLHPSSVDMMHSGITALQAAAYHGNIDVIKILLRYDADLHCGDNLFRTPLHHAVTGNRPEAVSLLLKSGANWSEEDITGITAPQAAFQSKFSKCLKAFLDWDESIEFKVQTQYDTSVPTKKQKLSQENSVEELEQSTQASNHGNQENEEETLSAEEEEPTCKICRYCSVNAATIQFEPCNCVISCFECCLSHQICGDCGEPIAKRSLEPDSLHLKNYVQGIRDVKVEIGIKETFSLGKYTQHIKEMKEEIVVKTNAIVGLQKRVNELEEYFTCFICNNYSIMCALSCGHMFCVPCVKKMRVKGYARQNRECGYCEGARGNKFPGPDPQCPICKTVSIYTVLYTEWPHKPVKD